MEAESIGIELGQWLSNFSEHQDNLQGLLKQNSGPHPRVSDPVGLDCNPRICISTKFPGGAPASDSGAHFENDWVGSAAVTNELQISVMKETKAYFLFGSHQS